MPDSNVLDKVYDPRAVEPDIYKQWEASGAFVSTPDGTPHEKTYTIVMPPPNVTGALHLGHALGDTLQDILIRYHRMRGFNTLWQPGTDHAGIATQAVVERRILELEGKTRHELGRDELVGRIWKWKDQYENRILSQLKLMGCSCDWKRTRFSLDDGLAQAVRTIFFKLFKDGLIFRGKRLVNWDTQLQTAVSDDEVYHETVKGHFWHIKYPVIDPKAGEPEFVIIATTRPETMLGDTAVAVHPDPDNFFAESEKELTQALRQLAGQAAAEATDLAAKLDSLAERRATHLAELVQLRDMARDGRMLRLPLVERAIPLICDNWADPTKGSGCVKVTPAHDPNDYEVGLRHDLPMINVLAPDGKIAPIIEPDGSTNSHSSRYEGLLFAAAGREKVVTDLDANGLLHKVEDHVHEVGHSDRSKFPIEPYLSDQWFLKTSDVEQSVSDSQIDNRASDQAVPEPRASARADIHTPDLSQGATLLTWTTYGTWLPGDQRGFVSRTPEPGGQHALHNLPGEPYDSDDPQVTSAAAEKMEGQPVRLSSEHAGAVLSAIASACERHGIEPLAIAVMANHMHVLCQSERHGIELLQLLKGNASRELNAKFSLSNAPRWWAKSGSRRRIKGGTDLTAAIEYVRHQKNALTIWSFDLDGGDAFDLVASARAKARGSGGVRLGDNTLAPGLAQAAMDAVNDGRIQVFPPRYAKSYLDWLGEKRDWCISRQLWWGHRISIWHIAINTFAWVDDGDSIRSTEARSIRECIDLLTKLFDACGMTHAIELRDGGRLDGLPSLLLCAHDEVSDEIVRLLERLLAANNEPDILKAEQAFETRFVSDAGPAALSLIGKVARLKRIKRPERDEDVLDTWFSSALWPFSTLGWPEETKDLEQYYPGSVLVTSRDIITNWVARMVMFGLYARGRVPFDHVYIHPKILDGRGETMSKSKGNGVDPVDVIHTHGADALRYAMADMTTETQDIRMPIEYICPHCKRLTDQAVAIKNEEQARKSSGQKLDRRLQPADCVRIKCVNKECGKDFATQWADQPLKDELSVARETSDKFDLGRNFCNKLWNAARFAFLNLEGTTCQPLDIAALPPEDRWILSRLSQTVRAYHECIRNYRFSASVKELREFFWDSLCDWYIELTKPRLAGATEDQKVPRSKADAASDPAQQILAFCMDQTLRLWHPTLPFITERLWQQLNKIAPHRGLPDAVDLRTDTLLISADFPPVEGYACLDDEAGLQTFAGLQHATRGVRELRSSCDVSPKDRVTATVVVPQDNVESFQRLSHIVQHMAGIGTLHVESAAKRPTNAASITIQGLRIYVHDVSDDEAERARATKALESLEKQIAAKKSKLGNEKFVNNAKAEVVAAEGKRLAELLEQQVSIQEHLIELG